MHLERMYFRGEIGLDCIPISGFRGSGRVVGNPDITKNGAISGWAVTGPRCNDHH